jgi:peptide/nickel transport system permease protein
MRQWWGLLGLVLLAILAPIAAPADPGAIDTSQALQAPSEQHWLGTDRFGRDVWSRMLVGSQRTLITAGAATVFAVLPGLLLGTAAAFGLGRVDTRYVAHLLLTAMLAFPGLLLALVVLTLLGGGVLPLALAVGISLTAPFAQMARGALRAAAAEPFVDAARATGAGPLHLLRQHILPEAWRVLGPYCAVTFSYAVLNSAALSFLGLSGDLGAPDWGTMLYEARMTFQVAPWLSLAPGLAITGLVWAIHRLAVEKPRV